MERGVGFAGIKNPPAARAAEDFAFAPLRSLGSLPVGGTQRDAENTTIEEIETPQRFFGIASRRLRMLSRAKTSGPGV